MEDTEQPVTNPDKSTNYLKWALVGFCVIAVVLIALIVILNLTKNKDVETFGYNMASTDCSDVSEITISSDIINCIGIVYDEGKEKTAMKMFDERISQAVEEKDGYMVADLVAGRSELLSLNNRCDLAIKYLNDVRIDSLDTNEKLYFYDIAADLCDSCGNAEQRDACLKEMEVLNEKEDAIYVYD